MTIEMKDQKVKTGLFSEINTLATCRHYQWHTSITGMDFLPGFYIFSTLYIRLPGFCDKLNKQPSWGILLLLLFVCLVFGPCPMAELEVLFDSSLRSSIMWRIMPWRGLTAKPRWVPACKEYTANPVCHLPAPGSKSFQKVFQRERAMKRVEAMIKYFLWFSS